MATFIAEPARPEETSRKIHLDFHTPHWTASVGQDYDPEALVQLWKRSHINAVTVVFGLCACGNAYYDSEVAPVHPGLRHDMLTPLLPVAKREGVKIYVHFGPGINDRAVIEHPEWAMETKDGKRLDTNGGKEWGWACYSSPYIEEWFWPQLREFVPRFPDVAGVFLDMVTFAHRTCYCSWCREKARELDLDLDVPAEHIRFQELVLEDFLRKSRDIVKSANPDMAFTGNCRWFVGGARSDALDFIELEAPVTWNSYHYPVMARYIRTLPKASGGMTTRFPKNWGYFGSLNNETQLKFECATILATLGSCCIGDQLHPSGKPEPGVYELVERVYAFVKEREAWALGAKSVPYLAVMADNQPNVSIVSSTDSEAYSQGPSAFYGAGLALMESNRHFDVLDGQSDFAPYKLLWFAENKTFDPAAAAKVKQFVADGGRLLVTGSGLWQADEWRAVLEELAGVKYLGVGELAGEFIQPLPGFAADMPEVPYFIKGNFVRWSIDPASGATAAAKVFRPYEEIDPARKFGHFHAPAGAAEADYPGAVIRAYGRGKVAVVAAAPAADYFNIGSRHVRQLTLNLLDALLDDDQRLVEVQAGSPAVDISLTSQEGRWVLHLVQYGAKRQSGFSVNNSASGNTVIEELPIRTDIGIRLRPPTEPRRLVLQPEGRELQWTWNEGVAETTLPTLHIHAMVVVEF